MCFGLFALDGQINNGSQSSNIYVSDNVPRILYALYLVKFRSLQCSYYWYYCLHFRESKWRQREVKGLVQADPGRKWGAMPQTRFSPQSLCPRPLSESEVTHLTSRGRLRERQGWPACVLGGDRAPTPEHPLIFLWLLAHGTGSHLLASPTEILSLIPSLVFQVWPNVAPLTQWAH